MSNKKTPDNIVTSIESGPIVVDILRGTAADGHTYLYYQPSRAWQPQNGTRKNFSLRFYERNEKDVVDAVQRASQWIRKHPEAADNRFEQAQEQADVAG